MHLNSGEFSYPTLQIGCSVSLSEIGHAKSLPNDLRGTCSRAV